MLWRNLTKYNNVESVYVADIMIGAKMEMFNVSDIYIGYINQCVKSSRQILQSGKM